MFSVKVASSSILLVSFFARLNHLAVGSHEYGPSFGGPVANPNLNVNQVYPTCPGSPVRAGNCGSLEEVAFAFRG